MGIFRRGELKSLFVGCGIWNPLFTCSCRQVRGDQFLPLSKVPGGGGGSDFFCVVVLLKETM